MNFLENRGKIKVKGYMYIVHSYVTSKLNLANQVVYMHMQTFKVNQTVVSVYISITVIGMI